MSRKITSVISLKIESTFRKWVNIFDSKEANLKNSQIDIKILFKGFSKFEPKKVFCVHQAPEGNIQNFVQVNSEWIKSRKVVSSTV